MENVLATLPAFPKGAPQQRAKRAAEALVKAQNYSRQMAMQQVRKEVYWSLKFFSPDLFCSLWSVFSPVQTS